MKSLFLTVTIMAVGAGIALAEDAAKTSGTAAPAGSGEQKQKRDPAEVFAKFDTNGDKAISLDEFKATPRGQKDPAKAEEIFKKRDTDGNGSLSLEEWKTRPEKGVKKEAKEGAK